MYEGGVSLIKDRVLAFLEIGRELPPRMDQKKWSELLGDAGLYLEEAYK